MAKDSLHFHSKALALRAFLKTFSATPTTRELAIQIDKLARMAEEFDKKFPWHSVLAIPAAKLRKQQGPHLHRLALQSKHIDKILWKALQEFAVEFTSKDPSSAIQKGGKAKLKKFTQKVVEYTNESIHKATEQLKLDTIQRARGELKE